MIKPNYDLLMKNLQDFYEKEFRNLPNKRLFKIGQATILDCINVQIE